MAFYQRASKLAFIPAGGAAAAASTSILLGRYTTSTTNHKLNQVASQRLTAIAQKNITASFSRGGYQQRLKSTIAKEEGGSKGFVEWYEGHLNARPVTTKAITGSILWGLGDMVAQVVPTFFEEKTDDELAVTKHKEFKYDVPRTVSRRRCFMYNQFISL